MEFELVQITSAYDVVGFPICVTFTALEPCVEAVLNTQIHASEDPNMEYSIAVKVIPYPNKVSAVWIFIASLVDKKTINKASTATARDLNLPPTHAQVAAEVSRTVTEERR
eukprot:TRINITY_DN3551_c0_g1_i1.p1 TRINITY_DN3551_c0_g1~~TRINITY_DN3551_c0_g1_i1.p1  ORF type:complete len:111 (-),score=19.85 TRINITY_DN3551_c0_g1_i1:46-378(-)